MSDEYDTLNNWSGNLIIVMSIILGMTITADLLNVGHPIQFIILMYAALAPVFISIYKEAYRVWKENYIAYTNWVMHSDTWLVLSREFGKRIGIKNQSQAGLILALIFISVKLTYNFFF